MTTATLNTHAPVRTNVVLDYLHRLQEAYTSWRNNSRAYVELTAMSDRELRDIELDRSDVDYVARKMVMRRY